MVELVEPIEDGIAVAVPFRYVGNFYLLFEFKSVIDCKSAY
jgi:hypothetical protein